MIKKSAFSVEKPEDSLGFLLWKNTTIWQRSIKVSLLPFDISHAQFVIMATTRWFSDNRQDPTQVKIAELSGLDKMTISKSLKKLVAMGVVSRAEDTHDTRAKIVVLTAKGNRLIQKLAAIVENIDRNFFGVMTDKEQKQLQRLFVELERANNDV